MQIRVGGKKGRESRASLCDGALFTGNLLRQTRVRLRVNGLQVEQ